MGFTAAAFTFLMMAILPAELGRHQHYDTLLDRVKDTDGPLVSFGHLEPSWVFYSGKPIREFGSEQREKLDESRLTVRETQVRAEAVKEQVAETGFDIETIKAELPEEATMSMEAHVAFRDDVGAS